MARRRIVLGISNDDFANIPTKQGYMSDHFINIHMTIFWLRTISPRTNMATSRMITPTAILLM